MEGFDMKDKVWNPYIAPLPPPPIPFMKKI